MAGFGAGFGTAFSNTFNQQRQYAHERETDQFRYRMEDLIKRRDKYDEWKRQDGQFADLAKKYVEATNQPPEAVAWAYDFLKNGGDEDKLLKILNGGKFSANKDQQAGAGEVATAGPNAQDPTNPAAQQTIAATGQNPASAAATPPTPPTAQPIAPQQESGGLLSQLFPSLGRKSRASEINQRVMDTTGMSQAEIDQIDKGYTPPVVSGGGVTYTPNPGGDLPRDADEAAMVAADAKAALAANPDDPALKTQAEIADRRLSAVRQQHAIQANLDMFAQNGQITPGVETLVKVPNKNGEFDYVSGYLDPNGTGTYFDMDNNPIKGGRGISPEETKQANELAKTLGTQNQKTMDKALGWAGMVRAGAGMRAAVEHSHGKVLQDWVSWASQLGQGLTGELAAAADVLEKTEQRTINELDPKELEDNVKKLQSINDAYSQSEAGKLAKEKLLFDAQNRLMAYYYGQAFDQAGRSLSQVEADMFAKMTSGGNDPHQFYENLASNLLPLESQIEAEGNALSKRTEVGAYRRQWHGLPDFIAPLDPRSLLKGDPGAEDLLHVIEPYRKTVTGAGLPPEGTVETPPAETTPPPPAETQPQGQLPKFNSPAEVDAAVAAGTLKSGDQFLDANGKTRTVP